MDGITTWVQQSLGIAPKIQEKLLISALVILGLWLLRVVIGRLLIDRFQDSKVRYQWQKAISYLTFFIGLIAIASIWLEVGGSLVTYLGLLSAGLAIALKDPITNLMGWMFILWRRPFEVGDRIQIGEYTGDVIDLRVFQFTLLEIGNWVAADQSTGRILHIPNGLIFITTLANYTKGSSYIWNEIPVLVTFESDWEKAKGILQSILDRKTKDIDIVAEQSFREATKRYMLEYGTLTSTVYTRVKDSGVLLTLRYLCEPRQRRNSEHLIWEEILRAFASDQEIEFAYPTQRFYNYDKAVQQHRLKDTGEGETD